MPDIDFSDVAKPAGIDFADVAKPARRPVVPRVTSGFHAPRGGKPHGATDWGFDEGEPVSYSHGGRVKKIGEDGRAGKHLFIDHGNGDISSLSHFSQIDVSEGDEIAPGEIIGRAGSTGRATGPHAHHVVRRGGARVNPEETEYRPLKGGTPRRPKIDFSDVAGQEPPAPVPQIEPDTYLTDAERATRPRRVPEPGDDLPTYREADVSVTDALAAPQTPPAPSPAPKVAARLARARAALRRADATYAETRRRQQAITAGVNVHGMGLDEAPELYEDPRVVAMKVEEARRKRDEARRNFQALMRSGSAPLPGVTDNPLVSKPETEYRPEAFDADGAAKTAAANFGNLHTIEEEAARKEARAQALRSGHRPARMGEVRTIEGAAMDRTDDPDELLLRLHRGDMASADAAGNRMRSEIRARSPERLLAKMRAEGVGEPGKRTLGFLDKWERVKADPVQLVPFLASVNEFIDLDALSEAASRVERGEGTQVDEEIVRRVAEGQKQDTNARYKVASVLAALPAFVGEVASTGGLYSGVKEAVTRGGGHAVERLLASRVGRQVGLAAAAEAATLKAAGEGVGSRALAYGGRLAANAPGAVAGGTAQSLTNPARALVSAKQRQMEEGGTLAEHLPEGLLDNAIEYVSERAGGALAGLPVPARLSAFKKFLEAKYLAKPGRTAKMLDSVLKRGGYNGVFGEVFEERVGDAARRATGLEDDNLLFIDKGLGESLEQLAVEFAAFAVPGGARHAASYLGGVAPVPESTETLVQQFKSAVDPHSPRSAVLVTPGEEIKVPKGFAAVEVPAGTLHLNRAKARSAGLNTPAKVEEFISENGFEPLIGKVSPVEDTSQGVALRTEDAEGKELSTSVVETPADAEAQKVVDLAQFPEAVRQEVLPAQEAAARRALEVEGSRQTKEGSGNVSEEVRGDTRQAEGGGQVGRGGEGVGREDLQLATEAGPEAGDEQAAQVEQYDHGDFGRVTVTGKGRRRADGREVVPVVDEAGEAHEIIRPKRNGQGNNLAVPVRRQGIRIRPKQSISPPASATVAAVAESPVDATPQAATAQAEELERRMGLEPPKARAVAPAKQREPWKMSRDEFVGSPNVVATPEGTFGDFTDLVANRRPVDPKTVRDIGNGYSVGVGRELPPPASSRRGARAPTGPRTDGAVLLYKGEVVGAFVGDTLAIKPEHRGKGLSRELFRTRMELGPIESRNYSKAGAAAAKAAHKGFVEEALNAGQPVPAKVLADYPDLAKSAPATSEELPSPVETVKARGERERQEHSVNRKPRQRRAPDPSKHSLAEFVMLSGGVRPTDDLAGEVKRLTPKELGGKWIGLVSKKGLDPEAMSVHAAEAGYLSNPADYGRSHLSPSEFLAAVEADALGYGRVYSAENETLAEIAQYLPATAEEEALLERDARLMRDPAAVDLLAEIERAYYEDGNRAEGEIADFISLANGYELEEDYAQDVVEQVLNAALERFNADRAGIRLAERAREEAGVEARDDAAADAALPEGQPAIFGEEVGDAAEPEGDVDDSFDFADDAPAPHPPDSSRAEQSGFGFGVTDSGLFSEGGPTLTDRPGAPKAETRAERLEAFKRTQAARFPADTSGYLKRLDAAFGEQAGAFSAISNSDDPQIKRLASELFKGIDRLSLRRLTEPDVAPAADVVAALSKLDALRRQNQTVPDYLAQENLFGGRELTPAQEKILAEVDRTGELPEGLIEAEERREEPSLLAPLMMARPDADLNAQARMFAEGVDLFLAGKFPTGAVLDVIATPGVLRALGVSDRPLTVRRDVLGKVLRDKDPAQRIPVETLKRVPFELSEPVAIFDSATAGGLVVLTGLRNRADAPVVVPLHLDKNFGGLIVHDVASVYGKDRFEATVRDWLDKGLLRYADTRKSPKLPLSDALQLRLAKAASGSPGSVLTEADLVNDRAPLREAGAGKNLDDLRSADFTDLVASASVTRTDHLLEVNAEGHEILRRAFEQTLIREGQAEGEAQPDFNGVFLNPAQIKETVRSLRDAADEMRANGYAEAEAARLDAFASDLITAAKAGKGTAIAYVFDDAVAHEEFHRAGFQGAVNEALWSRHARFPALADHPAVKRAWATLFSRVPGYTRTDEGVLVEETAAWIAGGKADALGLTEEEGAEFLDLWFESYAERNGDGALLNFIERGLPHVQRIIGQLRQRRADAGRDQGRDEAGRASLPREPEEVAARSPEGDQGSPQEKRERRTVLSAERSGAVDVGSITDRYYTVKSRDAAERFAQEQIERIGLDAAIAQAALPGEPSAERTALRMEVSKLLGRQAIELRESNPEQSAARMRQAIDLVSSYAPEYTEYGQAISQLARWTKTDPEVIVAYAQRKLSQRAPAEKLNSEQADALVADAQKLAEQETRLEEARRKLRNLQAKVRRLTDERPPKKRAERLRVASRVLTTLEAREGDLAARVRAAFGGGPLMMATAARELSPRGTDTPAFRRWIGNSVVQSPVYHGTGATFEEFATDRSFGSHFGTRAAAEDRLQRMGGRELEVEVLQDDDGTWDVWHDSEHVGNFKTRAEANRTAKGLPTEREPMAVYIKLENPLELPDLGMWGFELVASELRDRKLLTAREYEQARLENDREAALARILQRKGYDGVAYTNDVEDAGSRSYIVFSPTQIKSATGNRGTFDPADPNILMMARAEAEAPGAPGTPPPLSPDTLDDLAALGAIKLLRGLPERMSVADWDSQMAADFGPRLKPYLPEIHAAALRLRRQLLKTAREDAALKRLRELEGNENLSDDELRGLAAQEEEARKVQLKVVNEHYRRARLTEGPSAPKQGPKLSEGQRLGPPAPSAKERALVERIATESGADTQLLGAALRFTLPRASRNSVVRDIKRTHSLDAKEADALALRGFKLFRESEKAVEAEAREARGETAGAREAVRLARAEASRAKRELVRKLEEIERGSPPVRRRLNNLFRGIVVSALQTSVRNVQTQVPRVGIEAATDALEVALNRALRRVGLSVAEDALPAGMRMLDAIRPFTFLAQRNKRIAEGILDEFPQQYEALLGSIGDYNLPSATKGGRIADSVLRKAERIVEVANFMNRWQEFTTRRAVFMGTLYANMRAQGVDIFELYEADRAGEIPEAEVRRAVQKSLSATFAESPKRGTLAGEAVYHLSTSIPAPINPFTFARFMYNAAKFTFEYSPATFVRAAYRTARTGQVQSRDFVKAGLGSVMLLTAHQVLQSFGGDDDEWYTLRIPGVGMIDARPYFPFAAYLFMAHAVGRIAEGRRPVKTAGEAAEGLLGFSQFENPAWESIKQAPGVLAGDKGAKEKVTQLGQKAAGGTVGALLTPLKTAKDLIAAFDKEERIVRDYSEEPFMGGIKRNVPFASRGLPARTDPATGEPLEQPKPALKPLLGLRVLRPDEVRPKRTRAEELADDLRGALMPAGGERTKAEKQAAGVTFKLRDAARKGVDVEPRLREFVQKGVITSKQAQRVRDSAELSPLQEDVKALPLEAAERVYALATPEERLTLDEIIGAKRTNREAREEKEAEEVANPERAAVKREKAARAKEKRRRKQELRSGINREVRP